NFVVNPGGGGLDLDVSAAIGGNSGNGLTKSGTGTMSLTGTSANTYTGTTTVNDGTLNLNKSGVVAIPGDFVVGNTSSGALSDVVQLFGNDQIAATSN